MLSLKSVWMSLVEYTRHRRRSLSVTSPSLSVTSRSACLLHRQRPRAGPAAAAASNSAQMHFRYRSRGGGGAAGAAAHGGRGGPVVLDRWRCAVDSPAASMPARSYKRPPPIPRGSPK
eukprot:1184088-Prorocentrum_minimum.AAC.2